MGLSGSECQRPLGQPVAAYHDDRGRQGRVAVAFKLRSFAQPEQQRQANRRDGEMSELDAKVERKEGFYQGKPGGTESGFPQGAGKAETVNQPEAERQRAPAAH